MNSRRPPAGRLILPERFERTIRSTFGEAGADWLERLPELITTCASRWRLDVGPMYPLSYNWVAAATRADGSLAVLKLGVPTSEIDTEMAALSLYDGQGMVRLLERDTELHAMLLERLVPGETLVALSEADDEAATRIIAGVMRSIRRPAPAVHSFPTVERWAQGVARLRRQFRGGVGPLPVALVERAERAFADLLPSQSSRVVLHGDLHHENILSTGDTWRAIDPKGVIGEPEYEIGALLHNPIPGIAERPNLRRIMDRRIAVCADELGFDRARLREWGIAQAVLSACWSIEDGADGWPIAITCAEALAAGNA